MSRRDIRFLFFLAGALLVIRGLAVIIPPLRQLMWPTVPARVISAVRSSRVLGVEIGKWSNSTVMGRVRIVTYEYALDGRSYRVRAESHPSAVFVSLPDEGDTVRVRVDPQASERSALWPRPPFSAVLLVLLGLTLCLIGWRLGPSARPLVPRAAR